MLLIIRLVPWTEPSVSIERVNRPPYIAVAEERKIGRAHAGARTFDDGRREWSKYRPVIHARFQDQIAFAGRLQANARENADIPRLLSVLGHDDLCRADIQQYGAAHVAPRAGIDRPADCIFAVTDRKHAP